MSDTLRQAIEPHALRSHAGQLPFGEFVGLLAAARVESYHVDFRAGTSTFHGASDQALTLALPPASDPIAQAFDATAVEAAVRGAQAGRLHYPEFVRQAKAAGCASYTVWIDGRHVVYHGRGGQTHVERFP